MDTRRILTTVLMFAVIFIGFQLFMRSGNNGAAATQPQVAFTQPATQPLGAEGGAAPETLWLGDPTKTSKDKVAIEVDTVTAGIDLVELNVNDYAQAVDRKDPLKLLEATPGVPKPYATLIVEVNDGKVHRFDLYNAQYVWKVESRARYTATLLATMIDDAGKPLVEVRKIFTVDPASYDVRVEHAFTNRTDKPISVRVDQMAATDLPREDVRTDDRNYMAGYLQSSSKTVKTDKILYYHGTLQKEATPTKEIGQLNDFSKDPFLWVSSADRFFAAITRPLPQAGTPAFTLAGGDPIPQPAHVASAEIDELKKETDPADNLYGVKLTGAAVSVDGGGSVSLPLTVYFGPKDRNILNPSSAPPGSPRHDYKLLEYVQVIQFNSGGCYSYCSFSQIAVILLTMLDWIAKYITFHNYGLAIFVLVILVRAILHPLTKSSQINMATMAKKMNAIKPQLEAVKKKYADDKKREQEETMRVYRENNVNPAGGVMGCLPMLIQMPIWIAMYQGLWNDLDLRHAVFIPGWINDLAAPDSLFTFAPFTIPFIGAKIASFNLLPILLAVVFYFQMKIQTASQPKAADEQQAQIQKMSQFMFLIVPVFLYNAPAGLNLYYFASTTAGLVDMYIVRKTLKKRGILPANAEVLPTHQQDEMDEKK